MRVKNCTAKSNYQGGDKLAKHKNTEGDEDNYRRRTKVLMLLSAKTC